MNKKGFTMVELLVAMTMSLVVLAAVYMTFKTQLYSFQLAEQTAPLQQNVRVAKVFLERDIRMAGANMDGVYYPLAIAVGSPPKKTNELLYPITNDNDNLAGDAGSDKLTVVYIDYFAGDCGAVTPPAISCDDLPALSLSVVGMPVDAAAANIAEDLDDATYAPWEGDCECPDGTTFGNPPEDSFRAIITSPDGTRSDIIFITNVNDTGGINKIVNAPYDGFENKVANTYPEGSTISFFSEASYVEVTYDLVNGNLRRNGATIAENIEDLQFAFGLDTNDDGSVNSWVDSADLTPTQKLQVRLVRINILGRSSKEIGGTITSNRPAIEDHTASATQDYYKRRQLELTVKVRNLGI